jgi:hypothetical protein
MSSEYSSLPLSDDLDTLESKISDLQDDIDTLQSDITNLSANLNSVGNGNPKTMYSYKQEWHDSTAYTSYNSTPTTKTTSDSITVDDMRFIAAKFNARANGGSGSQFAQAILNDGTTGYHTDDLSTPFFFSVPGRTPAIWSTSYITFYAFFPVYDKTGDYTISFKIWDTGDSTNLDECYAYSQTLIE